MTVKLVVFKCYEQLEQYVKNNRPRGATSYSHTGKYYRHPDLRVTQLAVINSMEDIFRLSGLEFYEVDYSYHRPSDDIVRILSSRTRLESA